MFQGRSFYKTGTTYSLSTWELKQQLKKNQKTLKLNRSGCNKDNINEAKYLIGLIFHYKLIWVVDCVIRQMLRYLLLKSIGRITRLKKKFSDTQTLSIGRSHSRNPQPSNQSLRYVLLHHLRYQTY